MFSTLSAETLHSNGGTQRSPGNSFVAISFAPGWFILTVPYDGSEPTIVAEYTPETQWLLWDPITVGSDVVFWAKHTDRSRVHIYHAATGLTEPLLDVVGMHVYGARTDGTTLVWIQSLPPQSEGGAPTQAELWSSPYATTASGLAPQKIADLSGDLANSSTFFESGIFVLRQAGWARNVAVRVADGMYWKVDAPEGMAWGDPLYVSPEEIGMPLQAPEDQTRTFTIRRQKFADLGEPLPIVGVLGEP